MYYNKYPEFENPFLNGAVSHFQGTEVFHAIPLTKRCVENVDLGFNDKEMILYISFQKKNFITAYEFFTFYADDGYSIFKAKEKKLNNRPVILSHPDDIAGMDIIISNLIENNVFTISTDDKNYWNAIYHLIVYPVKTDRDFRYYFKKQLKN